MREQLWKFFLTFPVLERDELVNARGNYRVVEKKDALFASFMNDVHHNFVYKPTNMCRNGLRPSALLVTNILIPIPKEIICLQSYKRTYIVFSISHVFLHVFHDPVFEVVYYLY